MSAILKFDFQKKKLITFFRRKVSKLHNKDTILQVTITFFPRANKNQHWTHYCALKLLVNLPKLTKINKLKK